MSRNFRGGLLGGRVELLPSGTCYPKEKSCMRNTSKLPGAEPKNLRPRAANSLSYQNIAGGLASEMVDFLRCKETRKSSPPFRLVIVGNHGGGVFECEVGGDGRGATTDTVR